MVDFRLNGAHRDYVPIIEATYEDLMRRYPTVRLERVELFQPKPTDRSCANADVPGVIRLSAHWFEDPLLVLQRAAAIDRFPGTPVKWHGGLEEPAHMLTHEFGHVLADALPDWQSFAEPAWREATRDPAQLPTGYAMADPAELWAECFAMYELHDSGDDNEPVPLVREFGGFLAESLAGV